VRAKIVLPGRPNKTAAVKRIRLWKTGRNYVDYHET